MRTYVSVCVRALCVVVLPTCLSRRHSLQYEFYRVIRAGETGAIQFPALKNEVHLLWCELRTSLELPNRIVNFF